MTQPGHDSILKVTSPEGEWFEMIVSSWHIGQKADLTWVRSYRGIISKVSQGYEVMKGTWTSVQYPSDQYEIECVVL